MMNHRSLGQWWRSRFIASRRRPVNGTRQPAFWRGLEAIEERVLLSGTPTTPVISEFMAINDSSLIDEDGDRSDWIEIFNPTSGPIDLAGWSLTDDEGDLDKWVFPSVVIGAGDFLVVFASNKDRDDSGQELHTSFNLSGSGEYLALVAPDGVTRATEFAPYPAQSPDVSYGLGSSISSTTLIGPAAPLSVHVPADDSLELFWTAADFTEDGAWTAGIGPVGYDLDSDYDALIGLDVEASMEGLNPGAYIRSTFNVADPDAIDSLTLDARYDDGFVAYLNGQEVASRNARASGLSPETGLISYWNFDGTLQDRSSDFENNSGVVADNLSPRGGSARYDTGVVGQALAVGVQAGDATDLAAPLSADVKLPAAYAIEAWVKPTELTGPWQRLVLNWGAPDFSYHFAIRNEGGFSNAVSLFHGQADGSQPNANGGTVLFNQWQHLAGVADGTHLRVYLNGVEVASTPYNGTIHTATTEGLGIADSFSSISTIKFNGFLDEVAVWATPLSADQVLSHYQAGADGYGLTPSGGGFEELTWNSPSQADRPDAQALIQESITLTGIAGLIEPGVNVLAIHGLNSAAADRDFLMDFQLQGSDISLDTEVLRYFLAPSPGEPNGAGSEDLGPIITEAGHELLPPEGVTIHPLLEPGDDVEYHIPTGPALEGEWYDPDYVPGAHGETWSSGTTGLGYDTSGDFTSQISTNIQGPMLSNNSSAYLRQEFDLDDPEGIERLKLNVKYDDGFIAYLNGEEVARRNVHEIAPPATQSGLVTYYSFDSVLTDTASVYSAYQGQSTDNLVPVSGTTRYVPGIKGNAVALNSDLNGVAPDDIRRLQAPASADVQLAAQYTIEAWIHPTALNGWSRLVLNWGGGTGQSYHFALQNNNQVSLYHQQAGGAQPNTQGGAVQLNQWQHVAGVADGTHLRVYLNGVQVASAPYDGTITTVNGAMGLGDRPNGNDGPTLQFQGYLDEVAIWKTPLSASTLLSHFQAGSAGYGLIVGPPPTPANAPGLVSFWNFENNLQDTSSAHGVNTGVSTDTLAAQLGTARYAAGRVGQAIALDATPGDALRLSGADSADVRLGPVYTIEAWIYPTALNGWSRLVLNWGTGGQAYHFALRDGSKLSLFHNQSNGANVNIDSATGTVKLGSVGGWQHVVGVADGSTLKIYYNGSLVGSTAYNGTMMNVGAGIGIGDNPEGGGDASLRYQGLVDEVAVWQVPLTAQQIAAHYQAGAAGYDLTLPPTAPPAYNARAETARADSAALIYEEINLTHVRDLLVPGRNVLAIQSLNISANDDDLLIVPRLVGESGSVTSDRLHVTARVTPTANAVQSVEVHYRVMYGAEATLPMFDDGMHGDGDFGDGIYGATLPGSIATTGQMIRYYITADDDQGNDTRDPLYSDVANSPQYHGMVLEDPGLASELPVLHRFVETPSAAETGSGTRASVYYQGEFYDNVYIRIRGDTARSWPKKAYKIDFNPGHHFLYDPDERRVDEINLNTTYTDKSYIRTFLAYETYAAAGSPASLAFPMRMHQNGSFYSVTQFVEQPDQDYLKRNGMDPDGALYKAAANGLRGGTSGLEKRTRKDESFADIQAFINGLALTGGSLTNFIMDNVDLPTQINYMAASVIIQNIDRTVKNYYVYRDTEGDGEWHMMPWDVDLSFGPNALNTNVIESNDDTAGDYTSHPFMGTAATPYTGLWNSLLNAVTTTPVAREMFLRRLRTLMDQILQAPGTPLANLQFEARIDEFVASMSPDVTEDRARWSSSAHFGGTTLSFAAETNRIKNEYFPTRRTHLFNTHNINNIAYAGRVNIPNLQSGNPLINIASVEFNPASGDQDQEYIQFTNPNATAVDISGWHVAGAIDHTFAPGTVIPAGGSVYLTPDSKAFRARTTGPRGGQGLFVQGGFDGHLSNFGETIELYGSNNALVSSHTYTGDPTDQQEQLRITEVNYNPSEPTAAEITAGFTDNDQFEFIELRNISGVLPLSLLDVEFVSGVSFNFTGSAITMLAPGERVLIVADSAAFTARYGAGLPVAGQYTGSLSNDGETIKIEDSTNSTVAEFSYSDSGEWPGRADGNGSTLHVIDIDGDYNAAGNWRSSGLYNGSPGAEDVLTLDVIINEVLTHTDLPQRDSIELYNTTNGPIDLSGWWISDSKNYTKFQIPNGVMIDAHGYLLFDEEDFNPTPETPAANHFSFDGAHGEEAHLLRGALGNPVPLSFADGAEFDAAINGISFGRVPDGDPSGELFPNLTPTPNAANSAPKFGPLMIAEVMYHAPGEDNDLEYIELYNSSRTAIDLTNWRLAGAADFDFAPGTIIGPRQSLVILGFDPLEPLNADKILVFEAYHQGVTIDGRFIGPFLGNLADEGERVKLQQPDEEPLDEPGFIPHPLHDEMKYDDDAPWSLTADGLGDSLHRYTPKNYGHSATSWRGQPPTPGRARGDINGDDVVSSSDIDMLFDNAGSASPLNDLTTDGTTDNLDIDLLVQDILCTFYGDADLNQQVSIGDLTVLAEHFGEVGTASWSTGDFNGDDSVSIGDLTRLAENFGSANPLMGDDDTENGDATPAGLQALGDGTAANSDDDEDDDDALIDILADLGNDLR